MAGVAEFLVAIGDEGPGAQPFADSGRQAAE